MKNKTITNPMLAGAMELLKAENTPEHRKLVMEEIMHATFLTPVVIDPLPELDENGIAKLTPENNVQLPLLTAPDGKKYYMAFTDIREMQKFKKEEHHRIFGFKFQAYMNMMVNSEVESCAGVAINPFGDSLIIPREMIEAMAGKKNTEN